MRDYGHGPDDRTGDKLMRSLPQRQNRGRPAHLPLFAAIANDPFITPTPSQLPQKCSPRCRKFPLDTNAPDKWVRAISDLEVLATDDPVRSWRSRMLDLFDGLARRTPAYGD